MKQIILFGVCHTVATVNETLAELSKFPFNSEVMVFVEPKKSILEGRLKCDDPNIMGFFRKVLDFLLSKGVDIVPLNPEFTPSHYNPLLYRKIAQQFAEEEYMADVIASTETEKQKVVLIGDIHAPRIRNLLRAKGLNVKYRSLSKKTPSDIVLQSWRDALTGHARSFISMRWLTKFRSDLRRRLSLPSKARVPMIFYGNESMYHRYLKEAHGMEVRGEENRTGFMVNCDKRYVTDAARLKTATLKHRKRTKRKEDHEPVRNPQIR
ncbi:hypothetical protein KY362_05915 [Candidatus Woesearchaeota archaeon]|nr:hypothetical protein [Candidatus Woesearchaeota archaeon]